MVGGIPLRVLEVEPAPAARKGGQARGRRDYDLNRLGCQIGQHLPRVEAGQRAAIEAVRTFVDTVDEALPAIGERPSRRQEIIDAAMDMSDRLVHTQYEFIRRVVKSAGAIVFQVMKIMRCWRISFKRCGQRPGP